ncbi:MAG TPA: L,D-transpeptidase family protein [Anaerolineaceae bacterium]
MDNLKLTRRDLLKVGLFSLGSMAFRPFFNEGEDLDSGSLARVALTKVSVYSEPNDKSKILYQRFRDDILNVYEEVISPHGPDYNPLWYRVWRGYVHSAYLQRVRIRLNPVLSSVPKTGRISEVTVPYTQAYFYNNYKKAWEPVYRLYMESTHWIVGIEEGPDRTPWYKLQDELLDNINYHVPAAHLRPIEWEELTPLSPEVPPEKKSIEISITAQTLTAFEYDQPVFKTKISSGVPDRLKDPTQIKTDTPRGDFNIQLKMPSKHMGGGILTDDIEEYVLPGVPWVCFFEPKTGVAIHGTYWHTNFGVRMSHGCINMRTDEARWIYRWVTPQHKPEDFQKIGFGTRVRVF